MNKIPENKQKVKSVKEFLEKKKVGLKKINKQDNSVYEGSLIHLPLFDLSKKKRTKGIAVRGIVLNGVDYSIVFHKGIPTALGQDLFMYLLSLVPRTYDADSGKCIVNTKKLEKNGIGFTLANSCKGLGLNPRDSRQRKRIKNEFYKMGHIGISTGTVKEVERNGMKANKYVWDHTGFMRVEFYESTDLGQYASWENKVYFHKEVIESLKKESFRLYDFGTYKNLALPIFKRMYIIFGGHINTKVNGKPKFWRIGLLKLAEQLSIKANPVKDLRVKVRKGLNDLKDNKIIKDYEFYLNSEKEEIVRAFY